MELSKRHRAYLSVARYLATKSEARNTHGAVVVKGGRVLGTGFNKPRNVPRNVSPEHIKTDCSLHAEIVAARDAGDNLKGAVMYIARVNRQGQDRDSKPCKRCAEFISTAGIKRIYFTTENGEQSVSY